MCVSTNSIFGFPMGSFFLLLSLTASRWMNGPAQCLFRQAKTEELPGIVNFVLNLLECHQSQDYTLPERNYFLLSVCEEGGKYSLSHLPPFYYFLAFVFLPPYVCHSFERLLWSCLRALSCWKAFDLFWNKG